MQTPPNTPKLPHPKRNNTLKRISNLKKSNCIKTSNSIRTSNSIKRISNFLIIILISIFPSHPQSLRHTIGRLHLPDSIDVARATTTNFTQAAAQVFGMNIGLWAFDRYIQKGPYAYISLNTIKANLKNGFEWDNDHLGTNMFAHPYNGSLFFNAARSNGYNFWRSSLFAISGSAMWELFMEREYPSTNDIIATPIGGVALGEVLYRASDLVIDNRRQGWGRLGRETAAFIISPMRGLTRIINGEAWRHQPTTGRQFGTPPISVAISAGARILAFHDDKELTKSGAAMRIDAEYGDRFAETSHSPYDYFTFLMELNAMKTQPLLSRIEIQGRLLSRAIVDTRPLNMTLGMWQHFDYFDSDTISRRNPLHPLDPCVVPYKLGIPASVGLGSMLRYTGHPSWQINAEAHLNAVILGGILSDFYRVYHRNYNWASGFAIKTALSWTEYRTRLSLSINNQFYNLYTWNGWEQNIKWSITPGGKPVNVQGDESSAIFNHLELRLNYPILHRLFATLSLDWYHRNSSYKHWKAIETDGTNTIVINPKIISNQIGLQFMLTYEI